MNDVNTLPQAGPACNHCGRHGRDVYLGRYCQGCAHVVGVELVLCPCLPCSLRRTPWVTGE